MNLVLSGYFGFGNIGDEIILERMLKQFQGQAHTITVLSHTPRETAARHHVRAISRWNFVSLFRALRRCDALISGGGGLLQDLSGAFTPAYYLSHLALAQWLGKRTFVWGQGFGPLARKGNRRLARKILSRVEFIVVRDLASLMWSLSLGLAESGLFQGADLAWLLPLPEASLGNDWALCPRADWLPRQVPDWMIQVAETARARGRNLRIVSLGNRGDLAWSRRLQTQAPFRDCDFIFANPRLRPEIDAPALFQGTELVISQRYHGLVLGALAGAVVTGFGPDAKLTHLLSELEQPVFDPQAAAPSLAMLVESLPELRERIVRNREILIQRAQDGTARIMERLVAQARKP